MILTLEPVNWVGCASGAPEGFHSTTRVIGCPDGWAGRGRRPSRVSSAARLSRPWIATNELCFGLQESADAPACVNNSAEHARTSAAAGTASDLSLVGDGSGLKAVRTWWR